MGPWARGAVLCLQRCKRRLPVAGQLCVLGSYVLCCRGIHGTNGTHGITNHQNGQDMLIEHKQRQDAPPSPVPKRPGM